MLAAIDLLTDEVIPLVRDTHASEDFIVSLKILDSKYPQGDTIVILDNHSAHSSKKVKEFLNTIPGRFVFAFTPKHGSRTIRDERKPDRSSTRLCSIGFN